MRSRVRVAIITTGTELVPPGTQPLPGEVFDANATALTAAIRAAGAEPVHREHVADDPALMLAALDAATNADLIVTSGGISAGDHEVVREVLEPRGARVGHVAMQPGGPQATARFEGVPVVCFPGNPVSTQVSFEVFLAPLLRQLAGLPQAQARAARARRRGALAGRQAAVPARTSEAGWAGRGVGRELAPGGRARGIRRPRGRAGGGRRARSGRDRGNMGTVNAGLSHLDADGRARMVDVGDKAITRRTAVATGTFTTTRDVIALIRADDLPKADVLATARIAGIQGAKRTSELIPLCHPLPLSSITVDFELGDDRVVITATARTTGRTGVEMEALTAVAVAGLTLHDMTKAVDPHSVLGDIRVTSKTGGTTRAPVRGGTAAVLVASTSAAAGTREDTTGPVIAAWLAERGYTVDAVTIAADADVAAGPRHDPRGRPGTRHHDRRHGCHPDRPHPRGDAAPADARVAGRRRGDPGARSCGDPDRRPEPRPRRARR